MQLAIKLLPYIALAISLIVFLGLFAGLSRTVEKLRTRMGKFEAQILQAAELSAGISGLKSRIEELESGAASGEISTGKPASLSGTVRSKVLKMHRLGFRMRPFQYCRPGSNARHQFQPNGYIGRHAQSSRTD